MTGAMIERTQSRPTHDFSQGIFVVDKVDRDTGGHNEQDTEGTVAGNLTPSSLVTSPFRLLPPLSLPKFVHQNDFSTHRGSTESATNTAQ